MSDTEKRIQALESAMSALIGDSYKIKLTTTAPIQPDTCDQPDIEKQTERVVNAALAKCHSKIREEMTYTGYSEHTMKALEKLDGIIELVVYYLDENIENTCCIECLQYISQCIAAHVIN